DLCDAAAYPAPAAIVATLARNINRLSPIRPPLGSYSTSAQWRAHGIERSSGDLGVRGSLWRVGCCRDRQEVGEGDGDQDQRGCGGFQGVDGQGEEVRFVGGRQRRSYEGMALTSLG